MLLTIIKGCRPAKLLFSFPVNNIQWENIFKWTCQISNHIWYSYHQIPQKLLFFSCHQLSNAIHISCALGRFCHINVVRLVKGTALHWAARCIISLGAQRRDIPNTWNSSWNINFHLQSSSFVQDPSVHPWEVSIFMGSNWTWVYKHKTVIKIYWWMTCWQL